MNPEAGEIISQEEAFLAAEVDFLVVEVEVVFPAVEVAEDADRGKVLSIF